MLPTRIGSSLVSALSFCLWVGNAASAAELFRIEVVDPSNDRPVPLVELRTTGELRWVSDNAGVIAIDAPELFDRETWFDVVGHGYEVKRDGFGFHGVRLTPTRGGRHRLEVKRTNLAERVGRITGSGLFAESQKLGERLDWKESGIVGCDTVRTAAWKGKRFWLWGDTKVLAYPLGVFNTLGATTDLIPFDVAIRPLQPRFDYFQKADGRVRGIADIDHRGPVWLGGLIAIQDSAGQEHLVASYAKVRDMLTVVERGLCEWNEEKSVFELVQTVWKVEDLPAIKAETVLIPDGHVSRNRDGSGKSQLIFSDPLPNVRMPDSYEAWKDPASWIAVESPKTLLDREGNSVRLHLGCTAWFEKPNKWMAVFTEKQGKPSFLGEVWYTEAKSLFGPWSRAVKILTHDNYTFYNPCLHPFLSEADPNAIYFEGTYTAEFAKHPPRTPRYDYNQILYRLDGNSILE